MQADVSYDTYAGRDPRIIPDNFNRWQLRFKLSWGYNFIFNIFLVVVSFFLVLLKRSLKAFAE